LDWFLVIASFSSAPVVSLIAPLSTFHPLHHFLPCHLTLTHLSKVLDGFTAIGNDGDEHQLIYYLRKKSSVVARAVEPSLPLSCAGIKIQMAVTMHHCYAAATQTLIHKHWIKAGFC
jgi:hypothetical protein